jgi:hypothetical protein
MPPWSRDAKEATLLMVTPMEPVQNAGRQRKAIISSGCGPFIEKQAFFLSACRYGLIWWIVDMIESGEL